MQTIQSQTCYPLYYMYTCIHTYKYFSELIQKMEYTFLFYFDPFLLLKCLCFLINSNYNTFNIQILVSVPYLENIGEISQVEDVVELDGGRQEGGSHFVVQCQSAQYEGRGIFLDRLRETGHLEMLREDLGIDGHQSIVVGEVHREHTEVTLK